MKNGSVRKPPLSESTAANLAAYYIQDTLDDIAQGGRFSFKKAEKFFKKAMKDLK